ncbi:hypothetical protein Taro_003250 [Colocasia esculenta]|uniref:Uncharacterized protein n=1 Tax=Colocasia esculenta TaxID=4460 RepID=A0A843TNK8_COLES|nr:hypothetical protein [Colocasia esculenta]
MFRGCGGGRQQGFQLGFQQGRGVRAAPEESQQSTAGQPITFLGFLLTPLTEEGMVQVNITDWCMSTARKWLSTANVLPKPIPGI